MPSEDDAGPWWVAHTRSRHEKALADDLQRLGLPFYLPLCTRVTRSRRSGRTSCSLVPLFPGYVFFVATEEQRYRALHTRHVAHTLRVSDQTNLVRQLHQIDRALRSGEPIGRVRRLAAGDRVRVVAGPLRELEGVVIRWRTPLRLALNVDILGQAAVVEVDADVLERLD